MRFSAIALLLTATGAQAQVHVPFADIPGARVQYYGVTGSTVEEVRRSIDAAQLRDPNDGSNVAALTRWQFDMNILPDAKRRCRITPDQIQFSATVYVPQLYGDGIPPELHARFDRFLASLLAHEDGHVRNAWTRRGEVAKAINSARCSTARTAAAKAISAIAGYDLAYDRATDHGLTTIVPF